MQVKVGASQRNDETTTIYDQPISDFQILGYRDGDLEITFVAEGVYDRKSRYRYTVVMSDDELSILNQARQK